MGGGFGATNRVTRKASSSSNWHRISFSVVSVFRTFVAFVAIFFWSKYADSSIIVQWFIREDVMIHLLSLDDFGGFGWEVNRVVFWQFGNRCPPQRLRSRFPYVFYSSITCWENTCDSILLLKVSHLHWLLCIFLNSLSLAVIWIFIWSYLNTQ